MRQREGRAAGGGLRGRDIQEKLSTDLRRFLAAVRDIASDNRGGALALARRASETLLRYAESLPADDFHPALERAGRDVIAAQPAMTPLFHIVNRVLLAADDSRDGGAGRARVRRECRDFLRRLDLAGPRIERRAAALIREGSVILTHSSSETVLRTLLAAKGAGKRFEVVCTESRPVCEGRAMARQLAAHRIPVTLIVDAAAFAHLRRASLVLVGADSISTEGLVNKTGTSLLAAAARKLNVPVYVLCDSTKLLPARCSPLRQAPKNSREVLPRKIAGVAVENFYFDLTPLAWLSGVITEDGLLTPAELKRQLGRMRIHPALG